MVPGFALRPAIVPLNVNADGGPAGVVRVVVPIELNTHAVVQLVTLAQPMLIVHELPAAWWFPETSMLNAQLFVVIGMV